MFFKLLVALIMTNLLFAIFLFPWVTDDDFNGLRKKGSQRFIDLFYFAIVSFSTAGYGDISPKSSRAKMIVSTYLMFVNITGIYGFYSAFITSPAYIAPLVSSVAAV
jgi:hypothetical protein